MIGTFLKQKFNSVVQAESVITGHEALELVGQEKCQDLDCNNPVFIESSGRKHEFCSLHCKKNDYKTDEVSGLVEKFHRELEEYIKLETRGCGFTFRKIAPGENVEEPVKWTSYVKIKGILFPSWFDEDYFVIKGTDKGLFHELNVHLINCEFQTTCIAPNDKAVLFEDCTFHEEWNLCDYKILERYLSNDVTYRSCVFKNHVVAISKSGEAVLEEAQFDANCIFEEVILLDGITLRGSLFPEYDPSLGKDFKRERVFKRIHLKNVVFEKNFYLENSKFKDFRAFNATFRQRFTFKNNKVERFYFESVQFDGAIDCSQTTFEQFGVKRSTFSGFTSFLNSEFGVGLKSLGSESVNDKALIELKSTSFLGNTIFVNTKFKSGLNLETTAFNKAPNFYNIQLNKVNTTRQTFCIIKQSFEDVKNHVEANKYYALEMEAYRKELKSTKAQWTERVLLFFNGLISNHGQSYIRAALWWIVLVAISALVLGNDSRQWINTHFEGPVLWQWIRDGANGFAQGFVPLKRLYEGREHLSFFILLMSVLLSAVSWQLLVALRRYAKR